MLKLLNVLILGIFLLVGSMMAAASAQTALQPFDTDQEEQALTNPIFEEEIHDSPSVSVVIQLIEVSETFPLYLSLAAQNFIQYDLKPPASLPFIFQV